MKFAHKYKLKKDLPNYKEGWVFRWSGSRMKFYPCKSSTFGYNKGEPDIYLDYEHQGYTVEEIQNEEWFTPDSQLVDFIPAFPSKNDIGDFVHLHLETRLVDDVDECRAMNNLFDEDLFKDNLYNFVKSEYERKYKTG